MSDEAFISSLSDLTMKPQEQQELVRLNAQATREIYELANQ